jgi:general secretion pathway protein L
MSGAYALLLNDGSFLVAEKQGGNWRTSTISMDHEGLPKLASVFLDGRDVLGLQVNLPARNENEARKAAPFAIEDDVAEAVDEIHVALREPSSDQPSIRDLNSVSKVFMENLSAQLDELGLADAKVIAAHSLLGDGDILIEGPGYVLGRIGQRMFTLDADIGTDVLIGLCEGASDVSIFGAGLANALGTQPAGDALETDERVAEWLATQADAGSSGINLRQGAFQVRRSVDLGGFKQWRLAGALAAVLSIGWFSATLLGTHGMKSRTAELEKVAADFVNVGWPEANGDVQRALVLAGAEAGRSGSSSLSALEATSVLYEALASIGGAELRSVRYDRDRGQLSAVVSFESFADVDVLAGAIQARGLSATAGDARQNGNKVVGNITIGSIS